MNGVLRGMIIMLALVYCVSPIDFLPGIALDDIIAVLVAVSSTKALAE